MIRRALLTAFLFSALSACSLVGSKNSGSARSFAPDRDFAANVEAMSAEDENAIGRAVSAQILSRYKVYADATLLAYLNRVGAAVTSHSARPDTFAGYRFIILDSDEVNAMAAPGGYIFISRGLLRLLGSEDELAAVLAHEVTHVIERHGLEAIRPDTAPEFRSAGGKAISALDCSGLSGQILAAFGAAVDDIVDALLTSGYSREQEFEADAGAAKILLVAGYAPQALQSVLAKLEGPKGSGGWFSTHPPAAARVAAIDGATPSHVAAEGFAARNARFKSYGKNR